ncbi:MAG: hypothetical protein ACK55I_37035, partial [bacterium]
SQERDAWIAGGQAAQLGIQHPITTQQQVHRALRQQLDRLDERIKPLLLDKTTEGPKAEGPVGGAADGQLL